MRYGEQFAVSELSLTAGRGEFLTLLGPSGCGKTTTLRAIAGFVTPTSGHILVDGKDITTLPAHKRNIGMVFQSYALFPHLTVLENVGFGLRMRSVAKAERRARAGQRLWRWSAFRPWPIATPPSFRAASSSAWRSPAPWVIEPAILLLNNQRFISKHQTARGAAAGNSQPG